jgi:hypothetical protein
MIVKSVSIMAAAAGPILLGSPRCLAHVMRVHCLANSLRVPSCQTIVLNLYAMEGMLITGFTPAEVISSK